MKQIKKRHQDEMNKGQKRHIKLMDRINRDNNN